MKNESKMFVNCIGTTTTTSEDLIKVSINDCYSNKCLWVKHENKVEYLVDELKKLHCQWLENKYMLLVLRP